MAESSSHNPSLPKITPKEEPVTLDIPESPNPFLPADQIEFSFEEIAFTTNNEVALIYPSHPNSKYFRKVSDFISKCCLKEAFIRASTQYKEYLSEFWYTAKTLDDSKIWVSTPTGGIKGDIGINTFRNALRAHYLPHSSMYVSPPSIIIVEATDESNHLVFRWENRWPGLNIQQGCHHLVLSGQCGKDKETQSSSAKDKSLSHPSPLTPMVGEIHKEAQQACGGPTSLGATGHDALTDSTAEADPRNPAPNDSNRDELEQQKAKSECEGTSLKASPSYPDINQLTDILVTSLKHEFSKLLASHDFASCLPTKMKEPPSKFTKFSGEIKELKKHVKDMKIKLPGDLKKILTKLETFNLLSLPLPPRFATMVEHASGATTKAIPLAGQATTSLAEREKNTNPATTNAEPNLHDELVDLFGIDIMTREDGTIKVFSNIKVNDLHLAEWREVVQACPDRKEKGWKTIYRLIKTRMKYLDQTKKELKIDFNKSLKEQDTLNELNDLANKKRKRTGDSTDHSSDIETEEGLCKELQFSLVDNSKLNVVYLLNRSLKRLFHF
uniref:Uncharacterized protein n=1 Tax=Tanacetum cinerariifolium TaxID=118510 RepID=A0A6L2NCC7_TANCI|nr:hypothetical protein [Tanacetum cinerariifolium]